MKNSASTDKLANLYFFVAQDITQQIDISENSVRLEIFRYSSLWHDCAIADKPISFSDLNPPRKADILRSVLSVCTDI